jgi:hypothetical protein
LGRQGGEANDSYGTVVFAAGQNPRPVTIRLTPRGIVRGRVLQAEDDKPIAGARLFMDNGEILQSDANGRFEATGLSLKDHSLIPVAPSRARQYVIFDTSLRPEAELDIRLVRGGKLTGRVLDENNQPIPGAYAHRVGSGTTLTLNGWDEPCDAQGRYVLDGLPFERILWGIQAGAPGYEEEEHPRFVLRETEPTQEFTFRLKKSKAAASAQGKLLRRDLSGAILSPTNQPVPNALVRWGATMYETTNRETWTDKDGRFRLLDVPDRAGFITVMADDYAPIFPAVPEMKRVRWPVES